MTGDARLDGLLGGLTAKERAVLVLQAWREDRAEDPMVRWSMPAAQVAEFNRLVGLMDAVNCDLGVVLLVMQEQVEQLGLRYAWLMTLKLWGDTAVFLRGYLNACTKEPVTRGDLRRLQEEARAEWVPLDACAEIAAEEHEGWTPEDYVQGGGGREISDAAWKRVVRERKDELRRLAGEGKLVAKGQGARLRIQAGGFYAWLGQQVPVGPDWGMEHDVYPDRERAHVESLLRLRRHAQDVLAHSPGRLAGPLDLERPLPDEASGPGWGDELARALTKVLRERIVVRWGELRAIEVAVAEVAEEFDGEPVLRPDVQAMLDRIKARLVELHREVEPFTGEFALPEPADGDIELVRKLIERAAEG